MKELSTIILSLAFLSPACGGKADRRDTRASIDSRATGDTSDDTDSPVDSEADSETESDTDADSRTDSDSETPSTAPLDIDLTSAHTKLIGEEANDTFTVLGDIISVDSRGDFDGDGRSDLIVGLPGSERGGGWSGAVYVVTDPIKGTMDLSLANAILVGSRELAGFAVSFAGDTNADGFDDVLVGAPWHMEGDSTVGAAYLVLGPVTGVVPLTEADAIMTNSPDWTGDGAPFAGASVSSAGDTDGDGLSDVLVGAPFENDGSGAVYLFRGPMKGRYLFPDSGATFYATSGSHVGYRVSSAGDTDGDGFSEVLISDGDNVYLFRGPVSGMTEVSEADVTFLAGRYDIGEPESAGDQDGDGLEDLIIGYPSMELGGTYNGAAYVVSGRMTGVVDVEKEATATLVGEADWDYAGYAVDGAGDVDRDGIDDLVVSASQVVVPGPGLVYVLFGPVSGKVMLSDSDVILHGEGDDSAGFCLTAGSDVDGDGIPDIFIGGPGDDEGGTDAGAAWLVLGNDLSLP
jgi:hypothetical protein